MTAPVVLVVGGGVAGLAAALEVRAQRPDARVVLLEAAGQVGGKLRRSEVGGLQVDEGADAMLRRAPEGLALATATGMPLTTPDPGPAAVLSRGRLRPLPTGTLLGVPADLAALARSELLSAAGLARVPLDLVLPGGTTDEDVSVGDLVTRRLGREVVERLVDPLLGGVYAGRADLLSLQATLPLLAAQAARHRSLLLASREARGRPAAGPVFASVPGGLGALPAAVADASGADVRLRTTARSLERTTNGWRVTTGTTAAPRQVDADAVVLALPAAPTARLLRDVAPTAAADLATVETASVAVVTLVLAMPTPGRGSGYLVPAVEGRTTKAVTFTSRKWPALARPGLAVIRASVGRHGDEVELQRDDDELVALVLQELADVVGPLGPLVDSRVTRWGGGLPQYAVGHVAKVARVRRAVAVHPGLAVAGASYDGVGVPAVARSGQQAARLVLASLMMEP